LSKHKKLKNNPKSYPIPIHKPRIAIFLPLLSVGVISAKIVAARL
jgi:hypothetical protein